MKAKQKTANHPWGSRVRDYKFRVGNKSWLFHGVCVSVKVCGKKIVVSFDKCRKGSEIDA